MRVFWLGLALMAIPAAAVAQGGMGGMGGGGMGGPGGGGPGGSPGAGRPGGAPREAKPVKRARFDKAVSAMFAAADTNRDGQVTLAELRAVLEAKRDEAIRARFGKIDTDRNRQISFDEFAAWQRALGSAVMADGSGVGPVAETLPPPLGDDSDDRILERLVEPLSATLIAGADADYNGGVSLDEVLAHERKRFDAADTDKDGALSAEEQRALMPRGRGRPPGGAMGADGKGPGAGRPGAMGGEDAPPPPPAQ